MSNATSYRVKRAIGAGGVYTTLSDVVTANSFLDGGRTNGTLYRYRVYAVNSTGPSPDSNEVAVTPTVADNSIRQGGFETPNLPAAGYRYTDLVGSEWSFDHGSGIANNGSAFNNATAPEGVQVAFVQGTGSIRQTVTFGAGTYALRFKAAARGGLAHNYAIKIDGVTLDTLAQNNNAYSGYQQVTSSAFTLAAGAHEIRFVGLANVDRTVLLDDVQTVTATPTVPSAPTGLQAVAGNARVDLTWTAVAGATSYEVYAGTAPNALVSVGTANASNFPHEQLTNGTTYYYRVLARNASGPSPLSDQNSATPIGKPLNLTATAGDAQVVLNWDAVSGATGYKIKRSTTDGGPYTTLADTATGNSFTDSVGLSNGTPYYYRVYAINVVGLGPDSDQAEATPTAIGVPLPGMPTLSETAGNAKVTLTWNSVIGATNYSIRKSAAATGPFSIVDSVPHPTTTYVDNAVNNGTTYFYRIFASNNSGNGPDSNQVASTPVLPPPPSQPLKFENITAGQSLSGEIFVSIRALPGYVKREDVNFKVDGIQAGLVSLQGQLDAPNLTSISLSTERFANGSHTLTLGDTAGNYDQVTVTFQNDVSSLSHSSIMDLNTSTSDVPHNCRITADVEPGISVSVQILDEDQNVFRSFPPTTGNVDVVWDGRGNDSSQIADGSYFLSVSTSTSSASRQPSSSLSKEITFNGGSTGIEIPLSLGDRALGEVRVEDTQGRTVKVLRFNKQNSVVVWNGKDEDGNTVESGSYKAIFSSSQEPLLSAPLTVIDPIKGIINVDSMRDSLILISSDAANGAGIKGSDTQARNRYVASMAYAKKIVFQARKRAGVSGSFVQTPQALIVTPLDMATGAALVNRIDNHFRSRKVFIYVLAHGGWHVENGATYFMLDPKTRHYWFSSYSGTAPAGYTYHNMDQLTAPLNYGDRSGDGISYTDPPKLVWMDHCESAGSLYRGNPFSGYTVDERHMENDADTKVIPLVSDVRRADTTRAWADAFGIDFSNGFEGTFVGWSGYMFLPNGVASNQWDDYRDDLLNNIFGNRNIFDSW